MTDPFLGSISPSASILDPMGYTRTSFLDPSPVSSTSRPAALLGTYASAFNDAGGFISFARSSPAQAPWDPLGLTSEAADDGDPSYDPRLLSLPTPETAGDDVVDPVLAFYQRQAASADASNPPDALQTLGPVNIAIKNALKFKFDTSGWEMGAKLAGGLHIAKNTYITVMTYAGTVRRFLLRPGAASGQPAGWTNISFATDIPGTNIVQPNRTQKWILLPTKETEAAARSALKWGQQVPHLHQYIPNQHWGEAGPRALMQHYGVYTAGSKILNGRGELPGIVANGQLYSRQTFFGAIGRLRWVVEFQGIANQITREANGRYSSLAQLVVTDEPEFNHPDFVGRGANLTPGTGALTGFLFHHDEVAGHRPLAIRDPNGKKLRDNYDFSLHVRRALVYWGHAISSSKFSGNFKVNVQAAVRTAAKYVNLHHFYDGKNDPWSGSGIYEPSHPRGRELSTVRQTNPTMPWAGFGGAESGEDAAAVRSILQQIDQTDIPELLHAAYLEFRRDHPETLGQRLRQKVADTARGRAGAALAPFIIRLIAIPGVMATPNDQRPFKRADFEYVLQSEWAVQDDDGDNVFVILQDYLNDALIRYIEQPHNNNRVVALDRAFNAYRAAVRTLFDEMDGWVLGENDVIRAEQFRVIVNTAITGAENPLGSLLIGDPFAVGANRFEVTAALANRMPELDDTNLGRMACGLTNLRSRP